MKRAEEWPEESQPGDLQVGMYAYTVIYARNRPIRKHQLGFRPPRAKTHKATKGKKR